MNSNTTTANGSASAQTRPEASPEVLRSAMVDHVQTAGWARTQAVEEVMRRMPRHRFVPDASLQDAYADIAVITKRADDGAALSCASVPTIVAMMLDQLDVQPGHRILEIGAGTGYNAALLADLTGESGHICTIDIDPEVTAQARHALDANRYGHVKVVTRDGTLGADEHAPYDRIIFTVGAWDIPPAAWNQLAPAGRLVVPLRWRGQTRSIAFKREGDRLKADSTELCGFVPMIGQEGERIAPIDPDGCVALHWDADQVIDPDALIDVLRKPKYVSWSDVTVGPYDPFDGIWLRMTATEPATCRIAVEPQAIQAGLCMPAIASRSPAVVEGDSLAYFSLQRIDNDPERRSRLGAIGHGTTGHHLAERICQQIREWDQDRSAVFNITAHPAGRTDEDVRAGMTINKPHSRLVIVPT